MMKKTCDLLLVMICMIGFSTFSFGCASIVNTGTQHINVETEPGNSTVRVFNSMGKEIAKKTTPCRLSLERGSGYFRSASYRLLIEKDGYTSYDVWLHGKVNPWYLGGNFFNSSVGWFVIDPLAGAMWTLVGGIIVDPLSGAMWKLEPDEVFVNLNRKKDSRTE